MQPALIEGILTATQARNFDAALRDIERLRAGGSPRPMTEILKAYVQYWRAPGPKTSRALIQAQVDHAQTIDRACLYGWMSLKHWPNLPPRLLRGFIKVTVDSIATAQWEDSLVDRKS